MTMHRGWQAIGSIDESFSRARQQTDDIGARMSELSDRLLQVRNEESEAYRSLAEIRLGLADADPLVQRLKSIDASVRAALQRRSTLGAAIDTEVAALANESQALQGARALAAAALDERQKAFDAAAEATRARLEQTETYRKRLDAVQRAGEVVAAAESKTSQAEADRAEKGKPYEADELFQYLWKRGFGTSAYRAGFFARTMDSWVARLAGYDKARASFAMLNEIPRRLAEHARRQRELAEAEKARLAELQDAALKEGEAGARGRELDEAEAKLDAIDERIEDNTKKLIDAHDRRARMIAGEDPAIQAATGVIESALRQQDLQTLRAQAESTRTGEDDAAVARLEKLETEEQRIVAALRQAKADQDKLRKDMAQIESLRRDYRRRGYNRGTFDDGAFGGAGGALLGSLLGQVLGGAISRDVFWGEIGRRHQPPMPRGGGWGGGFGGSWGGGGGGGDGGGDFHTGGGF